MFMRSYSILIVFFHPIYIVIYTICNPKCCHILKIQLNNGLNILLILCSWCKNICVNDFLHLIYIIMCTMLRHVPTHQNVNAPMYLTYASKILFKIWFMMSCVIVLVFLRLIYNIIYRIFKNKWFKIQHCE